MPTLLCVSTFGIIRTRARSERRQPCLFTTLLCSSLADTRCRKHGGFGVQTWACLSVLPPLPWVRLRSRAPTDADRPPLLRLLSIRTEEASRITKQTPIQTRRLEPNHYKAFKFMVQRAFAVYVGRSCLFDFIYIYFLSSTLPWRN